MSKREIKFRVYSESLCIMYDPEMAKRFGGNLYVIPAMRDGVLMGDSDDIYMQFTGLLDKNGKEIYEGDIMAFPENASSGKWVVKWNNEKARYTEWDPQDKAIVIGNIYENPELL